MHARSMPRSLVLRVASVGVHDKVESAVTATLEDVRGRDTLVDSGQAGPGPPSQRPADDSDRDSREVSFLQILHTLSKLNRVLRWCLAVQLRSYAYERHALSLPTLT